MTSSGIFSHFSLPDQGPKPETAGIVAAIASWCDALHGVASLEAAFADLCDGLGASAGIFVRTRIPDPDRHRRIALHDSRSDRAALHPLRMSFAGSVFGASMNMARAGTIWRQSDTTGEKDPFLQEFQAARGFRDFFVLVLCSGPLDRDHIELHFAAPVADAAAAAMATVLPTMARTWATRQIGTVSLEMARRGGRAGAAVKDDAPILGTSNPAGLSRSEYRVCLLLSRGLSPRGVALELGVSDTTVKSHLRNVYAKTQTSGQLELLFRLIGRATPDTPQAQRYA